MANQFLSWKPVARGVDHMRNRKVLGKTCHNMHLRLRKKIFPHRNRVIAVDRAVYPGSL